VFCYEAASAALSGEELNRAVRSDATASLLESTSPGELWSTDGSYVIMVSYTGSEGTAVTRLKRRDGLRPSKADVVGTL